MDSLGAKSPDNGLLCGVFLVAVAGLWLIGHGFQTPWVIIPYSAVGLYGALLVWRCHRILKARGRGAAGRCPSCGYDLRGTQHRVCPECGEVPPPQVRISRRRGHFGRLVAALTGLAAGAGASGAVLAIQVVIWTYWGGWGPIGLYLIPVLWLLPLGSALALVSRRPGRVWFRARTGLVQGAVIAASWTASAGFVLAYTWYLLAF